MRNVFSFGSLATKKNSVFFVGSLPNVNNVMEHDIVSIGSPGNHKNSILVIASLPIVKNSRANKIMFDALLQYSTVAPFVLRLAIAVIFIYHALPKLKNAKGMAQMVGMPSGMVFLLGLVELVSSLGMLVGFYTQLAALLLGIVMVGAIGMKMMKWHVPFAAMDKTGWEFDLILLAANIALLLGGGGTIGVW